MNHNVHHAHHACFQFDSITIIQSIQALFPIRLHVFYVSSQVLAANSPHCILMEACTQKLL